MGCDIWSNPLIWGLKSKMEINEKQLEEALIEAFTTGQKAHKAPSYPMRIWAKEKIKELQNG